MCRLLTLGQNREFASWVFFVRRLLTLRPSTLRGLKGKRVFSDILVWRRWVWLASALLGHSMRHRWQLWFVQMFASRDQNRQLAIWVCLVRRLLNWRPPTRRAMKGKRVISVADVASLHSVAAALLGYESALHRFLAIRVSPSGQVSMKMTPCWWTSLRLLSFCYVRECDVDG